jgi:uncharacterized protein (TIGR03083 family)
MAALSRIDVSACHDPPVLSRDTYLRALDRDARAFGDLLRDADHSAAVPDCPGWSLADLARHLGGVHRWAHGIVTTGAPDDEPAGPDDPGVLVEWFDDGAVQLLDVLRSIDPTTPVWTFGPKPRLVEFWVRRQPHETSMHLGDARRALGLRHPVDVAFAADGVDEVATMMTPRQVRLGRIPPIEGGVRLVLRDVPGTAYVLSGDCTDQSAPTIATVEGTAHDLLLALWRRAGLERTTVTGDADAARETFTLALTP